MRSDMYLVRIVDGKVWTYEIAGQELRKDKYCKQYLRADRAGSVSPDMMTKRKPKAWKFGGSEYFKIKGDLFDDAKAKDYPRLTGSGVAAIAETWAKAYDMALDLQEREAV